MRGIARVGDRTIGDCSVHGPNVGGTIISSAGDVNVNNKGAARLGDQVLADCGHTAIIITASPNGGMNNRGIARLNDLVGDSPYVGRIITASTDSSVNG